MIGLLALLSGCGGGDPPAPEVPDPAPARTKAKAKAKAPGKGKGKGKAEVVKPAERDAAWSGARCNDGTPFAYTVRPGDPDLWVVNIAGGFFCDDHRAACADRRARLTTTLPEPDGGTAGMKRQGVFSPDPAINPDFATATHVDAHYCSSDLWFGDSLERRPNSGAPDAGWYFSGRENLRVLFAALKGVSGLDDTTAKVLVLGTSAGGAGVMGNLDTITASLPGATAQGRLKVVLDGSWLPEVPIDDAFPDVDKWGPVHPGCEVGLDSVDPAVCVLGPRWWPWVKAAGVPILVQISGLDKTQTPVFGVDTPEEQAAWQASVRASLDGVPWVFSGGHAYHVVAIDPVFDKGPEGQTFREVLGRFWRGVEPERVFFRYP